MIPMSLALDTPVEFIRGIGPRRAQILSLNGIHSVENLLQYLPFRYEDRTHFKPISKLKAEQEAVIQGEVMSIGHYTPPWKKMKIFEMVVSDGSASLGIKFFNQPYLRKVFRKGQRVVLFGVPRKSDFNQVLGLINPEFEIASGRSHPGVHSERIVPVYRRLGSLTTRTLRKVIFQLLACLDPELDDPLPESIRERYGFPHRRWAFQQIHFPSSPNKRHTELQSVEQPNQTLARKRFVFEEFFLLQCALQAVKIKRNRVPKGRMMRTNDQILRMIKSILPFHPTQAQKRVLKEIVEDLCRPEVMNRLLQGDVGSGKTIVAIQAMIVVMENNYQVALMANRDSGRAAPPNHPPLSEEHRLPDRFPDQSGQRLLAEKNAGGDQDRRD